MATELADTIYTAVFGDLDDRRFYSAKVSEIEDWLADGDGELNAAVLIAEWIEYDADDIAERLA